MNYDKMIYELSNETSGGGTRGIYEDIIEDGKVVIKGHREVLDRINMIDSVIDVRKMSILDFGSNHGSFCKYYSENKDCKTVGIEINELFVKWARIIDKKTTYINENIDGISQLDIERYTRIGKFDIVFAFSVWDYLNEEHFSQLLKDCCSKLLFFEGHADGEKRMRSDIMYNGKTLKSWEKIFNNVLNVKSYKLLGYTAKNTRPFFVCEM